MKKQERIKESALVILATSPSRAEAARILGVDPSTIYDWLKDEEFSAKLEQTRNLIVSDAISTLKSHTTKAVDTLAALLDDESSQIKRGTANDILNHVMKFNELQEIEARLRVLEKTQQTKGTA